MVMSDMFSFEKITFLALADSVNPCSIAVLAMILIVILVQNPEKKKKVLYSGLAFVSAVFMGYIFYGLILIQFFKTFAEFLGNSSSYVYKGLAMLAMILGALNVKDFFLYKKGGFATEMPLFLRPKLKRAIEKITSPRGAFIMGFLVTLFLLPCTIGPYIVASGILSELGVLKALPWLLYYNIVFVLPMLIIVAFVYFGFTEISRVSGWKDRNIKRLHLAEGIILILLGIVMITGLI